MRRVKSRYEYKLSGRMGKEHGIVPSIGAGRRRCKTVICPSPDFWKSLN
jgi:hypothetical protein